MVDMPSYPTKPNHIYFIYMYKKDLTFNNQIKSIPHFSSFYFSFLYFRNDKSDIHENQTPSVLKTAL